VVRLLYLFGVLMPWLFISIILFAQEIPGQTSLRWPTVQGRIVNISLSPKYRDVNEHIDVIYNYQIGRQTYFGSLIAYGRGLTSIRYRDMYPIGHAVQVSVDPDRPSRSVLEPGPPSGFPGLVIAACLWTGLCLFWDRRTRRSWGSGSLH